jgi:hypothetical protein
MTTTKPTSSSGEIAPQTTTSTSTGGAAQAMITGDARWVVGAAAVGLALLL